MRAVAVIALLSVAGCVQGMVYRHTIQPLSVDFVRTPVVEGEPGRTGIKQFRYRYLDFRWDSNGIGRIGKEAGFETVYYADLEVLSILGIWTQRWVLVYGLPDDTSRSSPAH